MNAISIGGTILLLSAAAWTWTAASSDRSDVANCVDHVMQEWGPRDFTASLALLQADMADYTKLRDSLVARPPRPAVKGRPNPMSALFLAIENEASDIQYGLREFLPIEDYPLAVLGVEDDLQENAFPPPTGHGRAHLARQSAFVRALFRLGPDAGGAGGDFVRALNKSYTMTSRDLRSMGEQAHSFDEVIQQMNSAIAAYPAFEKALMSAVADPDFTKVLGEEARSACLQSVGSKDDD